MSSLGVVQAVSLEGKVQLVRVGGAIEELEVVEVVWKTWYPS